MKNFALVTFLEEFYGPNFLGRISVWNSHDKKTRFFGADELDEFKVYVVRISKRCDVYIGSATHGDDVAGGSRGSAETAVMLAGVFVDVDFANAKQSSKTYPPDAETALAILSEFKHPAFLIQHSGNGLHVLYKFEKPIHIRNRDDRRRAKSVLRSFGRKLMAHFSAHGFEIDNVFDLARVYRVPGSFNHKCDPPKLVQVIDYQPDNVVRVEDLNVGDAEPSDNGDDDKLRRRALQEHYADRRYDHGKVRRGCGWYAHHTGDSAASSSEPEWFAAASITARVENGDEVFRRYSSLHPGYDRHEADRKLKHARESAGPRTCQSIEQDLGAERFCKACPHRAQITTPLQLGQVYGPGAVGPVPLGYTRDGSIVLRDQIRNILISAEASQVFSQQHQMVWAPSDFWARQFPPGERSRIPFNPTAAGEALMEEARRRGPFDPTTVRGRGVWREGDRIIVNFGGPIPADTKYKYLCFSPIRLDDKEPFDTHRLLELITLFPWVRPQEAFMVLGWTALAPICGALDWRPHLYVFGPPASGKTSLHRLIGSLLAPVVLSTDGGSTEAGIRQMIGPDSLPVSIDEQEAGESESRTGSVMRLARSASSADATVLRGTQSGKAMQFSLRSTFVMLSINPPPMTAADESRFLIAQLQAHNNDFQTGQRIVAEMSAMVDQGAAFCSHMIELAPEILPAITTIEASMVHADSRHRKNMATLLAGGFVALNGRAPEPEEAMALVAEHASIIEHQALNHERDDAGEALSHLLLHLDRTDQTERTLGELMVDALGGQQSGTRRNMMVGAEQILGRYDIRIITKGDNTGVFLRNNSSALNRVFAQTRWANGAWRRALLQVSDAFTPKNPIRFPAIGKKDRSVALPLGIIPDPNDFVGPASNEEF